MILSITLDPLNKGMTTYGYWVIMFMLAHNANNGPRSTCLKQQMLRQVALCSVCGCQQDYLSCSMKFDINDGFKNKGRKAS